MFFLGQLWKIENSKLSVKAGDVWSSNDTFEFNNDRIKNTLNKTVFGIDEDEKVIEMKDDGNNEKGSKQKWKKEKSGKGYFIFRHTSSGKALTAVSDNQLATKGTSINKKSLFLGFIVLVFSLYSSWFCTSRGLCCKVIFKISQFYFDFTNILLMSSNNQFSEF